MSNKIELGDPQWQELEYHCNWKGDDIIIRCTQGPVGPSEISLSRPCGQKYENPDLLQHLARVLD